MCLFVAVLHMNTQDMLTIAILLTMVMAALLFPGGPGTPRRFRTLIPARIPTGLD